MRGTRWVSWMITALLIGAGCGGGDSSDEPSTSAGGGAGVGGKGGAGTGGAGSGGGTSGSAGQSAGGKAGSGGAGASGSSGQSGSAGAAAQGGSAGAGAGGSAGAGAGGSAGAGAGGSAGSGAVSGSSGQGGASGSAGGGGTAGQGGESGAGGEAGTSGSGGSAGTGGGPAGLCCATSNTPGCDGLAADQLSDAQKAVQDCVCAGDAACCSDAWTDSCIDLIATLSCGPSCSAVEQPCASDAECDDAVFCNGVEVCTDGKCSAGVAPSCDDGVSCTEDFCDLKEDSCKHNKSDVQCSDGLFCNGIEVCDPATGDAKTGCVAGTPVVCNDGVGCTVDACDEASGACVRTLDDSACDNGVFCDGKETCSDAGCAAGTPPSCDDGLTCTIDACDDGAQACTHAPNDATCNNGLQCDGVETCDPASGDKVTGCAAGVAVPCASDGVACTNDACNEATGLCEHAADNTLCGPGQFCVPGQGNGCTAAKPCQNDAQCDDGDACNGKETCDVVCKPGKPVNCDDGIACTIDSCDKATGACKNAVNDTACDDGLICNGKETCDAQKGCVAGQAVNCEDGLTCTVDLCQEPTGKCVSTPFDVFCDDGKLCNGAEVCDPVKGNKTTGCAAGKPYVCPSDGISCTNEVCDTTLDACVSKEDDTKCACGQTCSAAKGGCGNFCVVKTCSNGKVYACGDCKDNDGDCKIDDNDSQCLGACDNTENAGPVQGSGCYFAPPPGQFNPQEKCSWHGPPANDPYPNSNDSVMTPVVINLTDDNADGKIDASDTPEVVFVSYEKSSSNAGVLRVVSGKCNADGTMKQLFSFGTNEIKAATGLSGLSFDFSGGVAAGDLDGDGKPEIVATLTGGGTIALTNDGKLKWIQASHPKNPDHTGGSTPSLANIDGVGDPEVITGRVVLNGKDGTLKWKGAEGIGYNGFLGPVSTVADIDLDGKPNVLAGNTAYKHDGTVLWTYKRVTDLVTATNCQNFGKVGACDGFTAVGNFDADNQAEVVIVSAGRIFIVNHDGTPFKVNGVNVEIPIPVSSCSKNEGGPPTIADFDGDGQPEIGVAGSNFYIVADLECLATPKPAQCSDVGIRWKVANNDCSSRVTGSSVFDFDGDGNAEVIYNDEQNFRIFDGKTGGILFQKANQSQTRLEMPIVADVDNDGKADVIFTENNATNNGGLHVWGDANNTWVSTRRIWNQHAYHVTNVNENGSIPLVEKANWMEPTTATVAGKMNNFRQNLPEYDALSAPDLSATVTFSQTGCPASMSAVVKVCNKGLLKVSAGVAVSLYDETTKAAIACKNGVIKTTKDLDPNVCQNVTCQLDPKPTATSVRACIDNAGFDCLTGGGANECNEDNNSVVAATQSCPNQ